MIAELIIPIETLKGQLRKDGYYFRMYRGKQIVQRCPNRSGHIKTESEKANQERFAEQYGRKKLASDVNGRNLLAGIAARSGQPAVNAGYNPAQRT